SCPPRPSSLPPQWHSCSNSPRTCAPPAHLRQGRRRRRPLGWRSTPRHDDGEACSCLRIQEPLPPGELAVVELRTHGHTYLGVLAFDAVEVLLGRLAADIHRLSHLIQREPRGIEHEGAFFLDGKLGPVRIASEHGGQFWGD